MPVPRFAPSFSRKDLWTCLTYPVRREKGEKMVEEFERAFASFLGVPRAVMVPSARMGLFLLLRQMGLKQGDEVLLPALTYFSIPSVMIASGIRPVFVDIEPSTFLMDPQDLRRKVTSRARAVIPTHLYGTPCSMDDILSLAEEKGLIVIEDCAQATGARWKGRYVGSLGDVAYFTFGLTKNMTTLSGGMLAFRDPGLAEKVREEVRGHTLISMRSIFSSVLQGTAMALATNRYLYPIALHPLIGLMRLSGKDPLHDLFEEKPVLYRSLPPSFASSRPRGIQAAVGLSQLTRLPLLNAARSHNGRFLLENLSHVKGLSLMKIPEGAEPIFMSFVVRCTNPEEVMKRLFSHGIDTNRGYMQDCSSLDIFREFASPCPETKKAIATMLHIPVHPGLTKKHLVAICEGLRRALLDGSRT